MRWGDSSASGRTVTLKLPDDGDEHPFKGLDVGAKNGQMLEIDIAIVDNGELETLSIPKKPKPKLKTNIPKKSTSVDIPKRQAVLENVRTTIFKSVESAPIKPTLPPPPPPPLVELEPAPPPLAAPSPPPMHQHPAEEEPELSPTPAPQDNPSSGNVDGANLDAYADQMGQAAEALAAVAERMDKEDGDDAHPKFPPSMFEDQEAEEPGVVVVRRAFDLCKAIDKQRAGFFYFMRSRYPEAPKLAGEGGDWSRDAKSTRDRVCLHCDTPALVDLAEDADARRRFEELENEFERHERLR